jgi:hypothetical protein
MKASEACCGHSIFKTPNPRGSHSVQYIAEYDWNKLRSTQPAQRSVRAGAQKANFYQFNSLMIWVSEPRNTLLCIGAFHRSHICS